MTDDTADFGLASGELRLVTVGPVWAVRFASERDRLSAAIGPAALDIQHIGSTAVPGILAKPILDIAVAIRCAEDGVALVPRLTAIGYQYRGEYGIPGRHYFVLGSPRRTHHLHMLAHGSTHWIEHLRFRDALRGTPTAAARYAALKRDALAACNGDRERYQDLKSSFITETRMHHRHAHG